MPKVEIVVVVDTCAMTAEVKCVKAVCEEKPPEAAGSGECAGSGEQAAGGEGAGEGAKEGAAAT